MKTLDELKNEYFDLMIINDIDVLFTPLRLSQDLKPFIKAKYGLYMYDVRSGEDCEFATIERFVKVNHSGTILSKTPFVFNNNDYIEIDVFSFEDEITIEEYLFNRVIIEYISVNDTEYRLFHLTIDGKEYCCAEEKLDKFIEKCIENNQYHNVSYIDERYEYVVPQEIADTENDEEIIESIADVIENG